MFILAYEFVAIALPNWLRSIVSMSRRIDVCVGSVVEISTGHWPQHPCGPCNDYSDNEYCNYSEELLSLAHVLYLIRLSGPQTAALIEKASILQTVALPDLCFNLPLRFLRESVIFDELRDGR